MSTSSDDTIEKPAPVKLRDLGVVFDADARRRLDDFCADDSEVPERHITILVQGGVLPAPKKEKPTPKPPMTVWPAALRLDQAAEYCGLSVDTFKIVCPVKPIDYTGSSKGNRWLRVRLDEWLASLDPNSQASPTRRFGEKLGG